jgi:tetratricopeptide (TPR) repeat protein
MNVENSERIRGVVSTLIQASCYDSAESLCCLHLSSLRRTEDANSIRLTPLFLELLGDIIFKKGEFKRALSYYRQSSQQSNLGLIANSRKRNNSIENSSDSQLRYKEGQCHIELKDYTTAIRELEAIPALLRDLKINMCMGKLYKSANLKRHAISCFILVIREVPSAVEAIDALVSLGIESGELLTLLDESCRASADSALYADGWLHTLSTSLIMKRNYEHDKCEIKLSNLLTTYPKNLHLLVLLGKNALNGDNVDAAMSYFKQARRVDPLAVDFMDQYGLLLAKTGEETELNKLAHELLGLSSEKPIGWLLVAMYCDLKRDSEKAMQFVEKVCFVLTFFLSFLPTYFIVSFLPSLLLYHFVFTFLVSFYILPLQPFMSTS